MYGGKMMKAKNIEVYFILNLHAQTYQFYLDPVTPINLSNYEEQ